MAANHSTAPHHPPAAAGRLGAALGVFWFFVTALLVLTAALVVVGGSRFIESGTVRVTLVAALALFAMHSWSQHRHRAELNEDERLRHARERRGF